MKTIFSFSGMRDAALDQFAEGVLVKMGGNPLFPDPDPALTDLETDLLAFRSSMVDAVLRSRQSVIVREQKRAALEKTLRLIAYYVDKVADGDRAKILSAGFEFAKSPENAKPCPKPSNVRVEYGLVGSGQAKVRVQPEKSAVAYRYEYRLTGTETWTEEIRTRSWIVLEGLESLQTYEFRVACIGTHPGITYSDVVSSLVL